MKLSEAMKLGAMLHPQGFRKLMHDGHTCALGAVAVASGIKDEKGYDSYFRIRQTYPMLALPASDVPCGCDFDLAYFQVCDVIWHLNDQHKWTRERIADWVESIEAAQSQPELVPVLACDVSPETPQ